MKIVIACDSFKGCLSSLQVAEAVSSGIGDVLPSADVACVAVGDGGEGTAQAIAQTTGAAAVHLTVAGPLSRPVEAMYFLKGDTAYMDMASAAGLNMTGEARRPMHATTHGVGEMMLHAIKNGAKKIVIGLGGSATVDGGSGFLQTLGAVFRDKDGNSIDVCGPETMTEIDSADLTEARKALTGITVIAICDVTNPLTGQTGAANVFGPQKGLTSEQVAVVDRILSNFAVVIESCGDQRFSVLPGSGAAGGLGFAIAAICPGALHRGIDTVLDSIGFNEILEGADIVITGEGRMDRQSLMGKTPVGILQAAERHNIPVIAFCGSIAPEDIPALNAAGFRRIIPVTPADQPLSEALRPATASANIRAVARSAFEKFRLSGF